MEVISTHIISFSTFKQDYSAKENKKLLNNIEDCLRPNQDKVIIQGDFNINEKNLELYFPKIYSEYSLKEVQSVKPTTPEGSYLDRVMFRNLEMVQDVVDTNVLTDHYPIITEFKL